MNPHLVDPFTHNRTVSKISRNCRIDPLNNARLSHFVLEAGKPTVELIRTKKPIHVTILYPFRYAKSTIMIELNFTKMIWKA